MQTRKLQKTGGSSLILTLPKKWIDRFHLQHKDEVSVFMQESGNLVVKPAKNVGYSRSVISIETLTREMIVREIIANYILGTDEIILKDTKITPEKRNAVREAMDYLMGMEIVDESSGQIVLKNLMDLRKFPVSQNIDKMFAISKAMFLDALKSLMERDTSLARDIIERDLEIDKLYFVITRQFHSLISDKITEEELNLSCIEASYFEKVASQIERIADHCVKIANISILNGAKTEQGFFSFLPSIIKTIPPLFDESITMVKNFDKKLAHHILDRNRRIEKEMSFDEKMYQQNPFTLIIEDSLDRLRGYIMNIAEITVDMAIAMENT